MSEQAAWEVEDGVRCVSCPDCAFTMDAFHTDDQTGEYTCPCCEVDRTRAERDRALALVESIQRDYAELSERLRSGAPCPTPKETT